MLPAVHVRRQVQILVAALGVLALAGGGAAGGASAARGEDAAGSAPAADATPARAPTPPGMPDPHRLGGIRLIRQGTFQFPTDVTGPPGDRGRLFVMQRAGVIRIIREGRTLKRPFLDFHEDVGKGGERGALSIAFPPDWAKSGILYFSYTAVNGDVHIDAIRRSAANPDIADPTTQRAVYVEFHPHANHNGGDLEFGSDGDLYMGVGDGGSHGDPFHHAQALSSGLGKIIRIQPHPYGLPPPYAPPPGSTGLYSVPADNPFVGTPGADPAVYLYGFRNPWRWSFDRLTDDFLIGDVGQETWEEIDFYRHGAPAGANFGWNACEGDRVYPPAKVVAKTALCNLKHTVLPALVHVHSEHVCAVIGGYVVRDPTLTSLYGRYVYGDLCSPAPRSAIVGAGVGRDDQPLPISVNELVSFGEDAFGCIYAVSGAGPVYRIAPAAGGAPCPGDRPAEAPLAHPPHDTAPPRVVLSVFHEQKLARGTIALAVRCDEPCTTIVTGTLTAPKKPRSTLPSLTKYAPAVDTEHLAVRLPRASRKLHHALAALTIDVSDGAGNAVRLRRQVELD